MPTAPVRYQRSGAVRRGLLSGVGALAVVGALALTGAALACALAHLLLLVIVRPNRPSQNECFQIRGGVTNYPGVSRGKMEVVAPCGPPKAKPARL